MNKVVIVGGNHHNGLGLARSFGRFGIEVISVVIDEKYMELAVRALHKAFELDQK